MANRNDPDRPRHHTSAGPAPGPDTNGYMTEAPLPNADHPVATALHRLSTHPTNAQILPEPQSETYPPDGDRPGSTVAGLWRCDSLCETPFWERLADAYSAGLATPHRPVGGACALQHYAGRFALAALGTWIQTGTLLSMAHSDWHVRLNEKGQTTGVAPPLAGSSPSATVDNVADTLLREHMRPIVDAVRAASRITDRVAYGCIAASCAGAFASVHRRTDLRHRGEVAALAERFMASHSWPGGRTLVDLAEITVPDGTGLVHQRHTCCLIRLGHGHGTCETCPDLDPDERWTRLTERASCAVHAGDVVPEVGDRCTVMKDDH